MPKKKPTKGKPKVQKSTKPKTRRRPDEKHPYKSTNAEIEKRIHEVFILRLDGAGINEIREHSREQGWNLEDAQLYKYMAEVNPMIKEELAKRNYQAFDMHLLRRERMYYKAMQRGDIKTAITVADSQAKIYGLFSPIKVAPTDPTGTLPYNGFLSDEERAIALTNLYARLGQRNGIPTSNGEDTTSRPLLGEPNEAPE